MAKSVKVLAGGGWRRNKDLVGLITFDLFGQLQPTGKVRPDDERETNTVLAISSEQAGCSERARPERGKVTAESEGQERRRGETEEELETRLKEMGTEEMEEREAVAGKSRWCEAHAGLT